MKKTNMKKITSVALSAIALVSVGVSLTGCGQQSASTQTTGPTPTASVAVSLQFNAQDASFVSMMIAHHQQAIEMSDIILAKSGVPADVTALATQIKQAQGPEIELMQTWLAAWGVPAVTSAPMDLSEHSMDHGIMTDDQLSELKQANGAVAGRIYLEQMIAHHEGAVEMSKQELQSGENPQAKALAQQIIDSQTAEIAQMRSMLASMSS